MALQMSRHWHWRVVQCLAGASGGTRCTAIGVGGTQPRQPILATASGGTT